MHFFLRSISLKYSFEIYNLTTIKHCFHFHFCSIDQNCTADIPHGTIYTPCPSGHVCRLTCDEGYRLRALAENDWMTCLNGEWAIR